MERQRKRWQQRHVAAAEAAREADELHVSERHTAVLWNDGRNVTIAPMEVRTFNVTFAK